MFHVIVLFSAVSPPFAISLANVLVWMDSLENSAPFAELDTTNSPNVSVSTWFLIKLIEYDRIQLVHSIAACNCESPGSNGVSCNSDGQCLCSNNFDGTTCNKCKESFYNYPTCEECNCNPAGVASGFLGCGTTTVPKGELCKCKERVTGRICNECKPLYWNLNISDPEGCRGETTNSVLFNCGVTERIVFF